MNDLELQALQLSLSVAWRSVIFSLPFAIGMAWLLTQHFNGKLIVNTLVHLPLVLPPVVTGYVLLLLFGTHGTIGQWLLQHLDIRLAFTRNGAALATAVMSFPLMVRSIRLSLEGIDHSLLDAARTLGAGRTDRFITITLPLITPGIIAGLITAFAASLGEFGAVITFAGNIPGETQTLALALYSVLQQPDGETLALHLVAISMSLAVAGLLLAEWLTRLSRKHLIHAN
ncbi:MAG: molybdate ABC transporter permease subunit [Steroidobacter sp.]